MLNSAGKSALLLLAIGAPLSAQAETAVRFVGEARSINGGELYYTETHEQIGQCREGLWRPDSHEVTYRDPNGDTIATKTMDYSVSRQRPGFELDEPRFDERMQVRNEDDRRVRIDWRTPEGEDESFEANMPSDGVIDAGFSELVRQNWDRLTEDGERVRISFLAPTRGEFYNFEVRPSAREALDGEHVFQIRPRGWVSRWFVDDIYLGYDDEGRLTDYFGLTNLRETSEENYTAHIRYDFEQGADCR